MAGDAHLADIVQHGTECKIVYRAHFQFNHLGKADQHGTDTDGMQKSVVVQALEPAHGHHGIAVAHDRGGDFFDGRFGRGDFNLTTKANIVHQIADYPSCLAECIARPHHFFGQ